MSYAENTSVPVDRSKAEIERTPAATVRKGSCTACALTGRSSRSRPTVATSGSCFPCRILTPRSLSRRRPVAGETEFDEEFLAHIVMPNGKTVAETAVPAVRSAYETGSSVPLLPGY